jgi:hypothetical protein
MGDVIKLRTARKAARRKRDDEQAAANRLLYGVRKADRTLAKARDAKSRLDLDRHRIEPGDER